MYNKIHQISLSARRLASTAILPNRSLTNGFMILMLIFSMCDLDIFTEFLSSI